MWKNIVWVTLDSVRADHTTMHGYERNTTPNLERISEMSGGQYYPKCIATGNGTPTSSASILTGTYPSHHGFRMTNDSLPVQLDTVPQLLGEQGYTTAGLSRNAYLSSGSNLDRGFDRFKWISGSNFFTTVDKNTIIKYLFNIRKHSAGITTDTAKHSTAFVMNSILKRWLKELQDDEPFFLYAHYNEPHRPYYPPHSYLNRYTEDLEVSAREAAEISLDIHYRLTEIIANGYTLSEQEERVLTAMYDAEIAYTDRCIGQLFDYVQSLDLEDTIIIVTADHGEYFGEHGLLGHTLRLDDPVVNVPLVVYGHDDIAHQHTELIQHIDLMQTLIARLEGNINQFQGIDLESDIREYTISQCGGGYDKYLEHNSQFDASKFHNSDLTALRTTEFRYQKSDDKSELYELPNESENVMSYFPTITEELDNKVEDWLRSDGQPINESNQNEFSNAMKKQLRELGYLE